MTRPVSFAAPGPPPGCLEEVSGCLARWTENHHEVVYGGMPMARLSSLLRNLTTRWLLNRRAHSRLARTSRVLVLSEVTWFATGATGSPSPGQPLRVATAPIAPFVFKDGEKLTGFSVALWNAMGARAGFQLSCTAVASPHATQP
jgi:ABC-type amino acid transport substrate-binding protein